MYKIRLDENLNPIFWAVITFYSVANRRSSRLLPSIGSLKSRGWKLRISLICESEAEFDCALQPETKFGRPFRSSREARHGAARSRRTGKAVVWCIGFIVCRKNCGGLAGGRWKLRVGPPEGWRRSSSSTGRSPSPSRCWTAASSIAGRTKRGWNRPADSKSTITASSSTGKVKEKLVSPRNNALWINGKKHNCFKKMKIAGYNGKMQLAQEVAQ